LSNEKPGRELSVRLSAEEIFEKQSFVEEVSALVCNLSPPNTIKHDLKRSSSSRTSKNKKKKLPTKQPTPTNTSCCVKENTANKRQTEEAKFPQ